MENHPTPCHRDVLILFAIVLTCCAKKVRTYNVCSRISKRLQQQKQKLQVKTVINFGPRTFCVDSSMVEPWQRHSQGLWFLSVQGGVEVARVWVVMLYCQESPRKNLFFVTFAVYLSKAGKFMSRTTVICVINKVKTMCIHLILQVRFRYNLPLQAECTLKRGKEHCNYWLRLVKHTTNRIGDILNSIGKL